MTSEVAICNLALARIGVKGFINSLNDASAEARVCKIVFEQSRDAMLESFAWQFATRRATLAVLDSERDDWGYVYAAPTDMIAPQRLLDGTNRLPTATQKIPFTVEANDDVNAVVILTDQEDAVLQYTYRATVVSLFPPLFRDALAWLIAAELVMPMSVKANVAILARQQYEAALMRAKAAAMTGVTEDPEPESEFITVRN